jgi:FHA domain
MKDERPIVLLVNHNTYLRESTLLIGRNDHCGICLPRPTFNTVSAEHASLTISEDGQHLIVEDRESSNGSTLNGKPLGSFEPQEFDPSDILTFGNACMFFMRELKAPEIRCYRVIVIAVSEMTALHAVLEAMGRREVNNDSPPDSLVEARAALAYWRTGKPPTALTSVAMAVKILWDLHNS